MKRTSRHSRPNERKLTAIQLETLQRFVATYVGTIEQERQRFGNDAARYVEDRGLNFADVAVGTRTLHALVERGLIEITKRDARQTQTLLRGAYGRWRGGTKTHHYAVIFGRPTTKALELVAADLLA